MNVSISMLRVWYWDPNHVSVETVGGYWTPEIPMLTNGAWNTSKLVLKWWIWLQAYLC